MTERGKLLRDLLEVMRFFDFTAEWVADEARRDAAKKSQTVRTAISVLTLLQKDRDALREALTDVRDGLGCQPGYVSTLALRRVEAALADTEALTGHCGDLLVGKHSSAQEQDDAAV